MRRPLRVEVEVDSRPFGNGVSQSMVSRAAFTSARPAVARSSAVNNVDLDLTGPDHGWPMKFEDDVSGLYLGPTDLSVSPAPLAQDFLPPAVGPLSAEQASFRRELRAVRRPARSVGLCSFPLFRRPARTSYLLHCSVGLCGQRGARRGPYI